MKKSRSTVRFTPRTAALPVAQEHLARQEQRLSRNLLDLEPAVRHHGLELLDARERANRLLGARAVRRPLPRTATKLRFGCMAGAVSEKCEVDDVSLCGH